MDGESPSGKVLHETSAQNFPKLPTNYPDNNHIAGLSWSAEPVNPSSGSGEALINADDNIEAKANTGGNGITTNNTPLSPSVSKKKRKSTLKVSILDVESAPPIPEGVNTPLSVSICQKHGFNPIELIPRNLSTFMEPGVSAELADIRYKCYEKRRQERMMAVLPKRQELEAILRNPVKNAHMKPRVGKGSKRDVAAADSVFPEKSRSISPSCSPVRGLNVSGQDQKQKQHDDHMENDRDIFPDNKLYASNVNNTPNNIRLSSKCHSSICSSAEHPIGGHKIQSPLPRQRESSHPSDRNTFRCSIPYSRQSRNASTEIENELQVLDKIIEREKKAQAIVRQQRKLMEKAMQMHFLKNQEKLINTRKRNKMTLLRHEQEALN